MLTPVKTLAPGFLIAMPQLGDPNFHRAVVLMLEHGEGGAMGLVINRVAPLTLRELAEGQALPIGEARAKQQVFVGGPVEPQRGFVLHDDVRVAEKQLIAPGLFLSVTVDALGPLFVHPEARLRFCMGYSGWGPQQLEQEIAAGAWLFTEAEPEAALVGKPEQLWEQTLKTMGVDPLMLLPTHGVH
jgi:putative transcriptional regulator